MTGKDDERALIESLYVNVAGIGPTAMVLLPPNPLDSSSWLFQAPYFSTWSQTLAVDLPGYGHSPRLDTPVTMAQLADSVWVAVEGAGVERAVIAGVSIGASLALHMTLRQPHRAIALVISGYGYGPGKPWARRRIDGYRERGIDYRREHLRDGFSAGFRASEAGRYVETLAEARTHLVDVPSIIELFEAHGAPDPDALFDVPCPTLLIMGSEDYAFTSGQALHERIDDAELAVIEGAGHACNIEQPAEWNALALEFLRRRADLSG